MKIIRPVFAGIVAGAALFFLPFFILRFFFFFLIIGFVFRFFTGGRGFRGNYRRSFTPSFTDNIRNMSEEEYSNFKQNFYNGCGWNNNAAKETSAKQSS